MRVRSPVLALALVLFVGGALSFPTTFRLGDFVIRSPIVLLQEALARMLQALAPPESAAGGPHALPLSVSASSEISEADAGPGAQAQVATVSDTPAPAQHGTAQPQPRSGGGGVAWESLVARVWGRVRWLAPTAGGPHLPQPARGLPSNVAAGGSDLSDGVISTGTLPPPQEPSGGPTQPGSTTGGQASQPGVQIGGIQVSVGLLPTDGLGLLSSGTLSQPPSIPQLPSGIRVPGGLQQPGSLPPPGSVQVPGSVQAPGGVQLPGVTGSGGSPTDGIGDIVPGVDGILPGIGLGNL